MSSVPNRPLLFRKRLAYHTRRLRGERQWTQEDLAHKAELHRNQIGVVEQGERNTGLEILEKLCRAFKVGPEELLGPEPQPSAD